MKDGVVMVEGEIVFFSFGTLCSSLYVYYFYFLFLHVPFIDREGKFDNLQFSLSDAALPQEMVLKLQLRSAADHFSPQSCLLTNLSAFCPQPLGLVVFSSDVFIQHSNCSRLDDHPHPL